MMLDTADEIQAEIDRIGALTASDASSGSFVYQYRLEAEVEYTDASGETVTSEVAFRRRHLGQNFYRLLDGVEIEESYLSSDIDDPEEVAMTFELRSVVFVRSAAVKGRRKSVCVKDVIAKDVDYIYKDVENGLWNANDLVVESVANSLAVAALETMLAELTEE